MAGKGVLKVHLFDARGLKSTDRFSRIDPYVILRFRGEDRKSRVLREGGSNPTWNEKFTFSADYPPPDGHLNLVLKLMDEDTFSADDFVGAATINVHDLIASGVEKGSAELPPRRYNVVFSDGTYRGEIKVAAAFRRTPS